MAVQKIWDGTQWVVTSGSSATRFPLREEVPNIEDIFVTTSMVWRKTFVSGDSVEITDSAHGLVLSPPFPIVVLGASITFSRGQAANATDYWTFTLRRSLQGTGSGETIAEFATDAGIGLFTRVDFQQYDPEFRYADTSHNILIYAARSTANSPNLGSASVTLRYARQ